MQLIVHSNSTEKYAKKMAGDYDNATLINVNDVDLDKKEVYSTVIGIGGGKVIDYAKILAGDKQSIAIPTTAAGAASTSHSVVWDKKTKKKLSVQAHKPVIKIVPEFLENIPKNVIETTSYDALGQCLDSYCSKYATEKSLDLAKQGFEMVAEQIENDFNDIVKLVKAGNISGEAIEITKTNMTHAISYPLTAHYDIPHGIAVGMAVPVIAKYQKCDLEIPNYNINIDKEFDIDLIVEETMTYDKIHDAKRDIDSQQLKVLLEEILL